jgi:U4/U6 small nuclear ribonucleoprotein PRP31
MTTLADSFLADLDDLSDDDARDGDDDARARANANANDATARAGTTAAARAEDLDDVATLTTTERYLRVTRAVDEAM